MIRARIIYMGMFLKPFTAPPKVIAETIIALMPLITMIATTENR